MTVVLREARRTPIAFSLSFRFGYPMTVAVHLVAGCCYESSELASGHRKASDPKRLGNGPPNLVFPRGSYFLVWRGAHDEASRRNYHHLGTVATILERLT